MIDGVDSKVYKLVSPLLVKVEAEEAKSNVEKRLEFIHGDIATIEKLIKTKHQAVSAKGMEIREEQIKLT